MYIVYNYFNRYTGLFKALSKHTFYNIANMFILAYHKGSISKIDLWEKEDLVMLTRLLFFTIQGHVCLYVYVCVYVLILVVEAP